ncbi:MAG: hypothetical protein M1828_004318 [Chrysothrix sp. TS-e1954]|nr:MAG: hypothetical protein M1828_004318 [Chrysothrix sp. TS-e1954]
MVDFHGDVVSHIVRRGIEVSTTQEPSLGSENGDFRYLMQIPAWGKAMLAVTLVTFVLLLASVRYTLWGLVPTLTAIETPQTTTIIKEEKPKLVDALAEENIDEEVVVINHKPITAKIRTTVKHLIARGGFRARWRGLSMFVVYMLLHGTVTRFFQAIVASLATGLAGLNASFAGMYASRMVASIMASILLARVSLAWTHIVISESSSKPWYQRFPSHKAWVQVWAPTAVFDIASRLPFVLPALFASATGLTQVGNADEVNKYCLSLKVVLTVATAFVAFFGFAVPAYVSLIRVQASLLPEEHESIVPFDRTFGGKVVPQILGGTGAISYVNAWATFDKAGRVRILRLVIKNIMIETGLHLLLALVLVSEVFLIMGPDNIRSIIKHGSS